METKNTSLFAIKEQDVLPLYFHEDKDVSKEVLKALYNAGIRTIEYTNRGEAALENFQVLNRLAMRNLRESTWVWAR